MRLGTLSSEEMMDQKREAQAAEPGRLQRLIEAVAEAILAAKPIPADVMSSSDASVPTREALRRDVDGIRGFAPAVYGLDDFRCPSAAWQRGDLAVYRRYQNGWGKAEFEDVPSHPRRNGIATDMDLDRIWLDAA